MSENNNLQEMYKYQEMKGKGTYEYVVRGAELFCGLGSMPCVLNLPIDHGVYTSDGRPLIIESDTKPENIKGFGTCKKPGKMPCACKPDLGTWSKHMQDLKIKDPITKKEEYAAAKKKSSHRVRLGVYCILYSTEFKWASGDQGWSCYSICDRDCR